jgi:hypothetical protein
VLGQGGLYSLENQLNRCEVRKVDDDDDVIKKEAEKILKYKTLQQKYCACGI